MTIALLATGDEIVHGDTLNTNAFHIAQILNSEGLLIGMHLSCSDKKEDIIQAIDFLRQQHETLIIIGGLGPTTDDMTRFALSELLNQPLQENPEVVAYLTTRLSNAKLTMNPGNLQQCLFPEAATILPNPNGTAVGCEITQDNKNYYLLPGPPRECLPMFRDYVLPKLQTAHHHNKSMLKWLVFGVAESEIAQTLEEALQDVDCQTGYRLDVPYIEFKVQCTADLVERVQQIVSPILKSHLLNDENQKASQKLIQKIAEIKKPITIIDEATGGLLQNTLSTPETFHFLNFHSTGRKGLSFQINGLEEYWQKMTPQGKTQLIIHYSNHNQEGGETHEIPFRSALVTHYAAEWLCFRLLQLINQLH